MSVLTQSSDAARPGRLRALTPDHVASAVRPIELATPLAPTDPPGGPT